MGDEIGRPGFDGQEMGRTPEFMAGYIHVVDFTDPENPEEVARYEIPEAGSHNMWIENDRLYAAFYNGGLRVVDISGELKGNLYHQGREIAVYKSYYNLDVTPDGEKLLATLKGSAQFAVWELATGKRLHLLDSKMRVTHGVVATPDGRYAIVTVEGIGGDPGTVEVIDLEAGRRVASASIGKQAGGIALWKMEGP